MTATTRVGILALLLASACGGETSGQGPGASNEAAAVDSGGPTALPDVAVSTPPTDTDAGPGALPDAGELADAHDAAPVSTSANDAGPDAAPTVDARVEADADASAVEVVDARVDVDAAPEQDARVDADASPVDAGWLTCAVGFGSFGLRDGGSACLPVTCPGCNAPMLCVPYDELGTQCVPAACVYTIPPPASCPTN